MTETITIRLSEQERRELLKHGKVSEVVREAIRQYLQAKNSKRALSRLKELQKNTPQTSLRKDLELIQEDRTR